jgi:hypothetical protein
VGRRIWIENYEQKNLDRETGREYVLPAHTYDCRVLSIKQLLPADRSKGREKHLIQLWTDPGGMRTLSVGSIRLKDPGRQRRTTA